MTASRKNPVSSAGPISMKPPATGTAIGATPNAPNGTSTSRPIRANSPENAMLAAGTARSVCHPLTSAAAMSVLEIARGVSKAPWLAVCTVDREFMGVKCSETPQCTALQCAAARADRETGQPSDNVLPPRPFFELRVQTC